MSSDPLGLFDALTAGDGRCSLHCWGDGGFDAAPWGEVVRDAEAMTAGLRRAGVRPGERVASVLTNGPQAVRGILGAWLAGGTLASLPVPARGMDVEEYARQLIGICEQLDPTVFLIEERMLGLIPESVRERVSVRSWESLEASGTIDPSPPGDDEVAFIQYSSGSTSSPKGCMLTPRAIAAQINLVMEMIESRPGGEVVVSWLPLSHDMGMFGCLLTPWANDFELYLSPPERFMFSPRTWFGDMAELGGTMTAGTSTALYLGARAYSSARLAGDLTRMSVCIIGAEHVEWDTLAYAVELLGPYGFKAQALMPAYGLAEATLAVSATPVADVPRRLSVDARALVDGELREVADDDPCATDLVSAGPPCRGVELPEASTKKLGEIRVRSPALASGYFADPERTLKHFSDGELLTGDLGFMHEGHLYPVGRLDDVICVGGRNVYTREIETALDALDGVSRGSSTIVEQHGGATGRLTLFLELAATLDDYRPLARRAASVAMAKAAIALDKCVFLQKGSLPKTPTGKTQRHRCRQMLVTDRFKPLATIELGPG